MDEKQIMDNMSKTIKALSEENEELKTQIQALQLTVSMNEKKYNESVDKAKKMIIECDRLIIEYKDAISSAKEAKEKYESAMHEFYGIKEKYQKKMEDVIKQI